MKLDQLGPELIRQAVRVFVEVAWGSEQFDDRWPADALAGDSTEEILARFDDETERLSPAGDDAEWVELYNQMGVDIDLSGWSLQRGVDYLFPEGTIIPAGGFVVVTSDLQELQSRVAPDVLVLGPFAGRLSNSGETPCSAKTNST